MSLSTIRTLMLYNIKIFLPNWSLLRKYKAALKKQIFKEPEYFSIWRKKNLSSHDSKTPLQNVLIGCTLRELSTLHLLFQGWYCTLVWGYHISQTLLQNIMCETRMEVQNDRDSLWLQSLHKVPVICHWVYVMCLCLPDLYKYHPNFSLWILLSLYECLLLLLSC